MAKKAAAKKKAKDPKPGPRSQALPGMEQVRDQRLDNLCEGIVEEREKKNAAAQSEQGMIDAALQRMKDKKVSVYKHGGIELALIPGADKLRVRLSHDDGDAKTDAKTDE